MMLVLVLLPPPLPPQLLVPTPPSLIVFIIVINVNRNITDVSIIMTIIMPRMMTMIPRKGGPRLHIGGAMRFLRIEPVLLQTRLKLIWYGVA
jgi:hypothetical protein